MYKVYLDTSERYNKLVELYKGDQVISEKRGELDLVSSIQELLEEEGISIQEVENFSCNLGPGSFTGLKLGVTICNILNWTLGKKKMLYPEYGAEPNIQR